jgi:hypothetical protein
MPADAHAPMEPEEAATEVLRRAPPAEPTLPLDDEGATSSWG